MKAYRKATEWVFGPANREPCFEMISQTPNTSPELAEQLYEIQLRRGVGNVPDASIDPEGVRNVLSLRTEFSGFEQPQDLNELTGPDTNLFDTGLLEEAAGSSA